MGNQLLIKGSMREVRMQRYGNSKIFGDTVFSANGNNKDIFSHYLRGHCPEIEA